MAATLLDVVMGADGGDVGVRAGSLGLRTRRSATEMLPAQTAGVRTGQPRGSPGSTSAWTFPPVALNGPACMRVFPNMEDG